MQHLLIPRIQWALLIYEIPMTLAFKLEQKVSVFIRKWLHLHHSTSSLCFYSSVSLCPLPIKNLSSALKASKIGGHVLLRNSKAPLVSSCIPKLQTGTWKVEDAVLSCKNDIKISQVCGSDHQTGMGLDTPPHQKSLKTNLQNITGDIFQSTTKESMTLLASPKMSNCRFRASGQDG